MSGKHGSAWLGFQWPRGLQARLTIPLAINLLAALLLIIGVSATNAPVSASTGLGCDPSIGILEAGESDPGCAELVSFIPITVAPFPPGPANPTPLPVEDLPELETSMIEFRLEPSGCVPWELCNGSALVRIQAFERMPGEGVENIHYRLGDIESMVQGDNATIRIPETDVDGIKIEYWAVSSFKETVSAHKVFKARFLPLPGDETGLRIFDLIGSDWVGETPPGSLTWLVFPPIDDSLPKALDQPFSDEYLYTTNRYIYLAGYLISSGVANAVGCPSHGLLANGSATVCGEKAAGQAVLDWQNQYNPQIYAAATRQNIPARVLKGIIAQETQFWPKSGNPRELGLGMFTENGADLVLMWNIPTFLSVCQPIYGTVTCSAGYATLKPPMQQVLRKAIIDQVGTEAEIDMLAATIAASASQIGQLIPNNTGFYPDEMAGYTDLWKIATGNYYAGAGCVSRAINQIANQELDLTWVELVNQMDENCKPAGVYVDRVFGASD